MGVGIHRDAVGPQLGHLADGAGEAGGRLQRQAVDQVDADGRETQFARRAHQRGHGLDRLHAMHGLLHGGVEVLHAEGQPVEAQRLQMRQPRRVDRARVDLDRQLGPGQQAEAPAQRRHHRSEFFVGQEGGRAAAQMQLRHRRMPAQRRGHEVHLDLQCGQIGQGALVVAGDDLVAGAVVAELLAEGDVDVDRQRLGGAALGQRLQMLGRLVGLDETVGGRVGGVARAGHVVAPHVGVKQVGVQGSVGHGSHVDTLPQGTASRS